jgi:hypothetical protein
MSSNKLWTLEKREQELRRVLASDAGRKAITRAAEHVREARLALLKKTESGEAPAQSIRGTRTKARANIQRERKAWLDATIADIVSRVQQGKV